ncbi:choice-of-anchor D domain-containing protein, partial [bacterium]|nr:choice-of-anchor D domain-containing protein [bacterium]
MNTCRWPSLLSISLGILLVGGLTATHAGSPKASKYLVNPGPGDTVEQARAAGATKVQDFGPYWLVEVDQEQEAELKSKFGDRAQKSKYLDMIELAAGAIDTSAGEPNVPAGLRAAAPDGQKSQLRLVQFVGPMLPEWLQQVRETGRVKILTYIPNNAYVVRVNPAAEAKLAALVQPNGPIQWIGDYHPHYKLTRSVREIETATVDIRLAVADAGLETKETLNAINSLALAQLAEPVQVLSQINLEIRVHAADVVAIAQLRDVLWIERVIPRVRMDEEQALIVATDEGGLGPSDYETWLTGILQFDPGWSYPVLDIADSGLDAINPAWGYYPWHPSFWASPFPINPNAQCGLLGFNYARVAYSDGNDADGHGTLVASVAAGRDGLPSEFLTCITELRTIIFTTNLTERFVTNSITYDCNPITCPPAAINPTNCCPVYQILRIVDTNIVESTNCEALVNQPPTIWPLFVPRLLGGIALGTGISPYGYIGASLGGADEAFAGPYNHGLNAYLRAARISNNSWGELLVVNQNDGGYDSFSQAYDVLTRDAVGTGSTNPPTPGIHPVNQELFYVFAGGNANGLDPGAGGYGDVLVTPPATAKNVLTVGASTKLGGLATFTSFGPTEDGRFKPEIMAPGADIYGAQSQASYTHYLCGGCNLNSPSPPACADGFTLYEVMHRLYSDEDEMITLHDGTSFAAPAVAGAAQLLWAWYQNRLLELPPSPAMMKAYMVNAAQYIWVVNPLTGVPDRLPSPAQGMGQLDLNRMFDMVPRILRDETTQRAIDSPLLTTNPVPQQTFFSRTGQSYEFSGTIYDATKPFRVTLTWTDPPGDPAAFKQLVNDLDLEVKVNNTTYRGNVFERQHSTVDPGRPFDDLNNLESVFLPAGTTGTWAIVVRARNIAGAASPNSSPDPNQDFVVVVYNAQDASDVPNPAATNDSCQTAYALTQFPTNFVTTLTKALYRNNHPSPSASRGGVDAFWKIGRPTIGTAFSIDTFGSDFDTVLSVWRGTWCGGLVEQVSNNNAQEGNFQSVVSFTADGTNDYYIVVEPHNQGPGGTLALNIAASLPAVQMVPASVDFGDLILGTTSTAEAVTLINNAPVPIYISDVSIVGDHPSDFFVFSDDCAGSTIPTGGSCIIYVKFAPTAVGARNALLQVVDDATGSPRLVSLSGNALAPAPLVCLNRSGSVVFSNQPVGTTSAAQTLVVTNCGTASLLITNIVFTGSGSNDFAATGSCLGVPVAPGGSCSISVTFTPTAAGTRQASLQIDSNAPDSPATLTVRGTGYVPAPAVCLNRSSIMFGSVQVTELSPHQSVVLTNCGTAPLSIISVGLSGANPGDFQISSDGCTGGLIATGATCTVAARFAPTVGGNLAATLVISNSAAGSPHTVALSGGG